MRNIILICLTILFVSYLFRDARKTSNRQKMSWLKLTSWCPTKIIPIQ